MKTVQSLVIGVLLFFGGLASGLILQTMLIPNSASTIQENWQITHVDCTKGANGWIAVTVNNTGISSMILAKVSINFVKQSTSPTLPLVLQPDTGTVLNMTTRVDDGAEYNIRVYTSKGNFSELNWEAPAIQQAGVTLYKENVRFYGTPTDAAKNLTDFTVGNSGEANTQILRIYIGSSSGNLIDITSSSDIGTGIPLNGESATTIMVTWPNALANAWQAGKTYYFKIIPAQGQYLELSAEAPA